MRHEHAQDQAVSAAANGPAWHPATFADDEQAVVMSALHSEGLKPIEGIWRRDPSPIVVLLPGTGDELVAIVEAAQLARDATASLVALATPVPPMWGDACAMGLALSRASDHRERRDELQAMLDLVATDVRYELHLFEHVRDRDIVKLCVSRAAAQLVAPGRRPPGRRLTRRLTRRGVGIVVTAESR